MHEIKWPARAPRTSECSGLGRCSKEGVRQRETRARICVCTCVRAGVCARARACVHACLCVYACAFTHRLARAYACVHTRACVRVRALVCARVRGWRHSRFVRTRKLVDRQERCDRRAGPAAPWQRRHHADLTRQNRVPNRRPSLCVRGDRRVAKRTRHGERADSANGCDGGRARRPMQANG